MNLDALHPLPTRTCHSAWFLLLFNAEFHFIPGDKWHSNLFRVGLLLIVQVLRRGWCSEQDIKPLLLSVTSS